MVFLNEDHSLSPGQKEKLDVIGDWQSWPVSREGWTSLQMLEVKNLVLMMKYRVVFASPVPVLLGKLALASENTDICIIGVFHSDNRVSKEIRNQDGSVRIVHTVNPDDMEIVWL